MGAMTAVAADADRNVRRLGLLPLGTSLFSMPYESTRIHSEVKLLGSIGKFSCIGVDHHARDFAWLSGTVMC